MTQPSVMQIDGNYTGPVFAVKLNEVLAAHTTVFAGDLSPTAPVANMVWQDTSIDPPMFRRRNSTNSAWDTMGQFSNNTYYGDCTGAAGTTDTLATPRVISLSGDVTGSAGFDGSANAPIAATLKTSNSAPGTYGSANNVPITTVNNKGLVTSIVNQTIDFPVDSFNGRLGNISLNSTDVFNVLPGKAGNKYKFLRLSAAENTLEWASPAGSPPVLTYDVIKSQPGGDFGGAGFYLHLRANAGTGMYKVRVTEGANACYRRFSVVDDPMGDAYVNYSYGCVNGEGAHGDYIEVVDGVYITNGFETDNRIQVWKL